ncbi:MAG: cyclase family protein [Candidatus Bathyarchaeia archaeon]
MKYTKVIDLSVPIRNGTSTPPSQSRRVEVTPSFRHPGFWQASWLSVSAHTSAHVDSPLHVIEKSQTIGEIDVTSTIGDAVILDLTRKQANEPITARDLEPYASDINPGDIVILRTDWTDKKWGTDEYWNDSPHLAVDGAEWLVKKKPKAIGFDFFEEYSARLRDFKPDDFIVHKIILGNGIIIMEGFTNLSKVPRNRFKLFAAPIKILDAEAAPARFLAFED